MIPFRIQFPRNLAACVRYAPHRVYTFTQHVYTEYVRRLLRTVLIRVVRRTGASYFCRLWIVGRWALARLRERAYQQQQQQC